MNRGEGDSAFAGLGRRDLVGKMHEQLDEHLVARDQMEQGIAPLPDVYAPAADVPVELFCSVSCSATNASYVVASVINPRV
jgi:hypothetical protein